MMKRMYVLSIVFFVAIFCLSGCSRKQYTEDDIIGLTSSEIVEKYGDFDRKQGTPDEKGLYRNCACGYLITTEKKGLFGTNPPEYFMIYFDDDGIAYWCGYEEVV